MINRTRFRSSAITQPDNGLTDSAPSICDDGLDMRNCSSRLTQEWLDEAKRIVAASDSHIDSSAKITGSPRFGSVRISTGALICRKDPLSRSARRNRATEGFSEEILSRSARHSRNGSILSNVAPDLSTSPTSQVNMWIANNIEPPNGISSSDSSSGQSTLPQRRSSRFQVEPKQDIPPRRFKQGPNTEGRVLSPPKNLVESAHRRSVSRSTCLMEKIAANEEGAGGAEMQGKSVNGFLKKQRAKFGNMMMMSKKA
ncbi:hypothetical protein LINGRAHAP2_LOCUS16935 [Linum grandiflorum]